uniref:Uncharacterized protein n=1 Tax=Octopus bimaculoides TaxID=37653 RepID=A0A0L8GC23_OCTBM
MQIVTVFLSITIIISLTSLNIHAKKIGNNCEIKISHNVSQILTRLVKSGKLVFNFEVHIADKKLDGLLNPVPLDYFANARHFMWIPDNPDGLVMYKNVLFDFSIHSFNILDVYIASLNIVVDINCGKQNIQRYNVVNLIFEELRRIVFIDDLQMGESGYMCFFINLSRRLRNNSLSTLLACRRLGINREILKNYCCLLHNDDNHTYESKSVCSGNIIENSMFVDCANIVGAVLWAIFPLLISFVSEAKLPLSANHSLPTGNTSLNSREPNQQQSADEELALSTEHKSPDSREPNRQQSADKEVVLSTAHASPDSREPNQQQLHYDEFTTEYLLPDKSEWICVKHDIYSFSYFSSRLFCFHHSTFFVSRLRRSILILLSLSVILLDLLMYYFFLYETLTIFSHDRIPLGYRSFILGIPKGNELSDSFVLNPIVVIISYIIVNFILLVLPSRLSDTIAYNALYQESTCTFLIKDKNFLVEFGNLNVTTLRDYDRLLAIMKANISVAANPNFWHLLFSTWIKRIKKIWDKNVPKFILFLPIIVITILFAVFSICELLLCLVYYGIPFVYLILTLPLSYFKVYILPLYKKRNRIFKCVTVILPLMSLPIFIAWAIYSSYVFLMSFQIICSYIFSIATAVLAKPETASDTWFVTTFFMYGFTDMKGIQEHYHTLLVEFIQLTKTVRPDLVLSKYGEEFIKAKLFKEIVNNHCSLRHEIGKSILKLFLVVSFFFACNNIINRKDLDLSRFTRIALVLMTSAIPKFFSKINTKFPFNKPLLDNVIETIKTFGKRNESESKL